MITGYVTGQALRFGSVVIAAGTLDWLEVQFVFMRSGDWEGLTDVRAVFERTDPAAAYSIPLTFLPDGSGRILPEDHLNLTEGVWAVHLVGVVYTDGTVDRRITTEPASLTVRPSGATNGPPLPDVPLTEAERLWAEIEFIKEHGGGTSFTAGHALAFHDDGTLNVVTADGAEQDNTLPITSAGVHTIVGNISALLDTI